MQKKQEKTDNLRVEECIHDGGVNSQWDTGRDEALFYNQLYENMPKIISHCIHQKLGRVSRLEHCSTQQTMHASSKQYYSVQPFIQQLCGIVELHMII